jgi:ATPase subunit of ABC transporter with duplicated ATPase domains
MDPVTPEQRQDAAATSSQQQPHTGQQQQQAQQHAGPQQQKQQQAQAQRNTALKQSVSGAAEDFLDCEELNSDEEKEEEEDSSQEGEEEDSGSEDQQHHSGDELPLISQQAWTPDHTFKVLLVGDSGVGKTALCMRCVGFSPAAVSKAPRTARATADPLLCCRCVLLQVHC